MYVSKYYRKQKQLSYVSMHELMKLKYRYIHLGVNSRVMWYVEQKSMNKHLYGQMEQRVAND